MCEQLNPRLFDDFINRLKLLFKSYLNNDIQDDIPFENKLAKNIVESNHSKYNQHIKYLQHKWLYNDEMELDGTFDMPIYSVVFYL